MNSRDIREIRVGDQESFSGTIIIAAASLFAGVNGDMKPVHVNRSYAAGAFLHSQSHMAP